MEKKIIMLGTSVLCRLEREVQKSNIVLPDGNKRDIEKSYLIVESVGPEVTDIKEGDTLLVNQFGEHYFVDDEHVIFPRKEIIAVKR